MVRESGIPHPTRELRFVAMASDIRPGSKAPLRGNLWRSVRHQRSYLRTLSTRLDGPSARIRGEAHRSSGFFEHLRANTALERDDRDHRFDRNAARGRDTRHSPITFVRHRTACVGAMGAFSLDVRFLGYFLLRWSLVRDALATLAPHVGHSLPHPRAVGGAGVVPAPRECAYSGSSASFQSTYTNRMNICVFCSGQEVDEKYREAAEELGKQMGSRGHTLIWGGSNGGLMRTVADAVQSAGGKIVGISVEFVRAKAREKADEMVYATDLPERKRLLRERSDAIVVLPGGTGTLDEITEVLELKKHGFYKKPIVFLNTDNFYEGLLIQLEKMESEDFLARPLKELALFAKTPREVIKRLEQSSSSTK